MRMSEKCPNNINNNNNSDNPLTSCRTDGGKNIYILLPEERIPDFGPAILV